MVGWLVVYVVVIEIVRGVFKFGINDKVLFVWFIELGLLFVYVIVVERRNGVFRFGNEEEFLFL